MPSNNIRDKTDETEQKREVEVCAFFVCFCPEASDSNSACVCHYLNSFYEGYLVPYIKWAKAVFDTYLYQQHLK